MAAAPDPGVFVKGIADDLHRAMSTFARMDAVLITAVNGVAAGAGFSLGVSGDLVLAAESASFTMAYTKAGLSPDGGASYVLPRLVGLRRTQDLMITNRVLKAPEALAWGLVTEVVADADLPARLEQLAAQIAAGARGSNASVKRLLLSTYSAGYETQLEHEARQIAANASSPDGKEGIAAFLGKRAPAFG
jgi:2-(1,2-epoxy-1,2-dihydrophenyl)acetyl-CoA isomerase